MKRILSLFLVVMFIIVCLGVANYAEPVVKVETSSIELFGGISIPLPVIMTDQVAQENGEQYLFAGTSDAYAGVTTEMLLVINEDVKGDSSVFDLNFPEYEIEIYENVEYVENTGYDVTDGAFCLNRDYIDDSAIDFIINPTITDYGDFLYSLTYFNNGMQGIQDKYDTMHYFPAGSVILMKQTNTSNVTGKVSSSFTWFQWQYKI